MTSTDSPNSTALSADKRKLFAQLLRQKGIGSLAGGRIPRRSNLGEWPLSFAQRALWFLDRLEPGSPRYNVFTALWLGRHLNLAALERSVSEIVLRHEVLRACVVEAAGEPGQQITPPEPVSVPVVDLAAGPEEVQEAELRRLAMEEARRPFDLAQGPLLRCSLVRMAEDHVLLVSLHHIVSDGWSIEVFSRELGTLYDAFSGGRESPLPELPLQYADFAAWQKEWLRGPVLEEQLSYWRMRLRGVDTLSLPTDHPRPAVQRFAGASRSQLLGNDLAAGLKALSQREGVTLFMTLLAAFQVLLHRYTSEVDIAVGCPVANRSRAELEELIGFFVNVLVMRNDLSGDPTFQELLARVRDVAVGAYAHQDLPFEKIVEELRPERDLSRNPIFQVAFVLQRASGVGRAGPAVRRAVAGRIDDQMSKFDLTLSVTAAEQDLAVAFEYSTDLFDSSTVERMLSHFGVLLEGIVVEPERRVSALPLVTEGERAELVVGWNRTRREYPREATIAQVFEEQARRTPEAVAAVFDGQRLSYGELEERANRLAWHLRGLGVGADTRVGICCERSLEMVVGLLGILKAGGAYVPLDPSYPSERLAFMLADSGVRVLVTQERLVGMLPEHGPRVVRLDADGEEIARQSASALPSVTNAEHLAYVIYTSGSTGIPKGIAVTHRAVNRLVLNTDYVQVEPSDRIAQASNASFDAATFEIWGALLNGARLVGVSREASLSPRDLAAVLKEQGVTILFLTTALFNAVAREDVRAFSGLRHLLFGGEAVDPARVREVLEGGPPGRLLHVYGPTETTTYATWHLVEEVSEEATTVAIGRPIANTTAYVLDARMSPVPVGVAGELYLGGDGLARGYLGRPELTAEKFVPNPFGADPGGRLYRTGDLVRYRADGSIEFLGRIDHQVKVRGFRIELGEIEMVLGKHPAVREALVVMREDEPGEKRLVAYITGNTEAAPTAVELRSHVQGKLPEYMVPSAFVVLDALPLNPNGKVDRRALPAPETRPELEESYLAPRNEIERTIAGVWQDVLKLEKVGVRDNFFDLGGHSLLLLQVQARLSGELKGKSVSVVDLFRYPTIQALAGHLSPGQAVRAGLAERWEPAERARSGAIAIVGMAGRFPGARDLEAFWKNLRGGVESITFFDDEGTAAAGIPREVLRDPRYVGARGTLDDVELFDASFFRYNPREAESIDPQQRLFLECAWEALESAGYDPDRYRARIGAYGGLGLYSYAFMAAANRGGEMGMGALQGLFGSGGDFLSTRLSYKLNLRGPSLTVQTACSTSLVAVHLACKSLLDGECEMALAGGVSAWLPQAVGYLYEEGGILSPDGHCRAFDARAKGTVGGNGVGIVVLKRLEDAVSDGDRIEGVIRGTAINNDGAAKVGYTAPSVEGQAAAIAAAQAAAGIKPSQVGYIEAHGTGTPLGDPIEIAALTQVFRAETEAKGFCAIGSLKTNVGHLDAAAGVAGLIKAVLTVKHGMIPPSLNFEKPNPEIDFAGSPFYVNTALSEWRKEGDRRIAGVSSFGIGGTNAHVVVEEPPVMEESGPSRPAQLLNVSAKTESALEAATAKLAGHLREHPELKLADVAYTLALGRGEFDYRRVAVCRDVRDAGDALERGETHRAASAAGENRRSLVAFLFPGQGSQYVGMGSELYREEAVFREELDRCAELLAPELGLDLRGVIHPEAGEGEAASDRLKQTSLSQPALFVVEYALAKLWMSWGVRPEAMIGHSIGEYVAACLSGVFTVEEALGLVASRGKLMQGLPSGAMLAVGLGEDELRSLLGGKLSLAASNGPSLCVVSGVTAAVEGLERELGERGVECRRLHTSHAFHSGMVEPILSAFAERVGKAELKAPRIPYVSNVTGTWIRAEEVTDPGYWTRHLRQAVRFGEGVGELLRGPRRVLLEVGPGQTLSGLVRQHPALASEQAVITSARHPKEKGSDEEHLLKALGRLWMAGVEVDWGGFYAGERRRRVSLPTYPFERQRYWVDAPMAKRTAAVSELRKKADIADWFYVPSWTRSVLPICSETDGEAGWLVFADDCGLGAEVVRQLAEKGRSVVSVRPGERFAASSETAYTLDPHRPEDYQVLLQDLRARGAVPNRVAHLWGVTPDDGRGAVADRLERSQDLTFYSLLFLAQAIGQELPGAVLDIAVVTNGMQHVTGDEALCPEKAAALGVCKVIPQEYPAITCRSIDVDRPWPGSSIEGGLGGLIAELEGESSDPVVAHRRDLRWVQSFQPLKVKTASRRPARLRENGVYLITGGLGGIGLELAASLASVARAKLVLTSRSLFPPRQEWPEWLGSHDAEELTSRRIRKMQALEKLGAEVLVVRADVASESEMQAAVERTLERFGALHGVIHAAGAEKLGRSIAELDRAHCERQFRPKLHGVMVLAKVLEGRRVDFCMLQSSLASVLGVVGFLSYTAAHLFMDAFACLQNRTGHAVPWMCSNWDNWETWNVAGQRRAAGSAEFFMTAEEGADAFARVMDLESANHVVVSTGDLQARIDQWITRSFLPQPANAGESAPRHSRPDLATPYAAPRTEAEETLAEIWEGLLGLERVGIHDNFFDLGGDSVLSIQVASRSAERGLRLSSHDVLEHQTIAALATVARTSRVAPIGGGAAGPVPLTPIQQWFFDEKLADPHHFNQAMLLELRQPLELSVLERALRALVEHHDALRLRYIEREGAWRGEYAEADGSMTMTRIDLAGRPEAEQEPALETAAAELQASLDVSKGPLLRAAYFDLGSDRPGRLLLIIHHLLVDVVSWRILREDLETACRRLHAGQPVQLAAPTTSFGRWAQELEQYARSAALEHEADYWLSLPWERVSPVPVDKPGGINALGSVGSVSVVLDVEETRRLLQEFPERHKTQINDVLLTAVAMAFRTWTGADALVVDLEGHGREAMVRGTDLSRTVGWFTTLFPVLLDVHGVSMPLAALKRIKEQLRAIPSHGIGYGLLRHLRGDEEIAERLRQVHRADVSFLYLGRLDATASDSEFFRPAARSAGPLRSPRSRRQHLLEVTGHVRGGQLCVSWMYSEELHHRSTIEALAEAFVETLRTLLRQPEAPGFETRVPTDFPGTRLNRRELEEFLSILGQPRGAEPR